MTTRAPLLSMVTLCLAALPYAACDGGGDSGASSSGTSGASSGTSGTSGSPDASAPNGTSSSGTSGTSGAPPPGCTDGGPLLSFHRLDSTRIRITSLEGARADLCGGGGERRSCAFPLLDAILTVPDTSKPGSWTLPHPEVTLTVQKRYPISRSEAGCSCLDPTATPEAVTSGTITLEPIDSGGYASAIELDGVPLDGDTGGKLSALVSDCK